MSTVAALLGCVLLAVSASPLSEYPSSSPTSSGDMASGSLSNATTVPAVEEDGEEMDGESGEGEEEEVTSSCPNCCQVPANKSNCLKGSKLGRVDHTTAFGFPSNSAASWSSCALPVLPQAK